MKCLYYPGCSQKASSISYEKAFLAIAKKLGVELIELDDWNCCGTTVTISVNEILAMTLSARNLAIAEAYNNKLQSTNNEQRTTNLPIVAPCPSCYITLSKVNKLYKDHSPLVEKINDALGKGGLQYNGTVEVYNILDFLANKIGPEKIKEKVVSPINGMKVAPYYGCQLVTPYASGDNNSNPQNMEKIIEALGGIPVDFTHRTQCCGGSLMITRKPQAEEMSTGILRSIDMAKADLVATPCGLCQVNLDFAKAVSKQYLGKKISLPVLTIAQLVGVALGTEKTTLKPKTVTV